MTTDEMGKIKREFFDRLKSYFTGLVHYQYDINHSIMDGKDEGEAEEAYKTQQKYLDEQFWHWIESKLKEKDTALEKQREEMVERIQSDVSNYLIDVRKGKEELSVNWVNRLIQGDKPENELHLTNNLTPQKDE